MYALRIFFVRARLAAMTTITFDTLKFVERLKAGGVGEAQARAEAEALVAALSEVATAQFATQADVARLERKIDGLEVKIAALEAKFATLEAKLDTRFSALEIKISALAARLDTLELRLTVKLGVMLTIAVSMVAAIVKLL